MAIFIPLIVAVIAALCAYIFNIQIERKRAYLKRTSDQLQYLYGPLRALTFASNAAWSAFIQQYGSERQLLFEIDPINSDQIRRWRQWMISVFAPLHEKMEKIIIENTHLIEGDMPQEFGLLLAHIASYKAVIARWSEENLTEFTTWEEIKLNNTGLIDFPSALDEKIEKDFEVLMKRHEILLDSTQGIGLMPVFDALRGKLRSMR
jgi:hypothetical protein